MIGELITTAFTYDQGRVAINDAWSANTGFETLSATTYFSGTTNISDLLPSFYKVDGNITGDRIVTTDGDVKWRKSGGVNPFSTLLWNDNDNTIVTLHFKCEDHGPTPTISDFEYAKFGIIFSATNIFGCGDAFFCTNGSLNQISASTNDYAIKIESTKAVTFASAVTFTDYTKMNSFIDFSGLTSLPPAHAGRVFFSGTPLFRLMICTGDTSDDWRVI